MSTSHLMMTREILTKSSTEADEKVNFWLCLVHLPNAPRGAAAGPWVLPEMWHGIGSRGTFTGRRGEPRTGRFPPPDVDSAIVRFTRKAEIPSVERRRRLDRIVKDAFSQRRKKMFKVLSKGRDAGKLENAFAQTGINLDARPGGLTVEKFLALADALEEVGAPGNGT